MSTAFVLSFAMVLDALLGEPRWIWGRLPHPAVLMGRAVGWLEERLNNGTARRAKGAAALALLVLGAAMLGMALGLFGWPLEIIVVAVLLAQRSLVDHVRAVADALRMSVAEGRRAVGMIVGRDTAGMDRPDIARAAIESAAENLSDGVIAPAFWFLVAGLPGLLIYKIANTADSMIGYRTERYEAFGWAAARFDDVLNVIPARLTALLIAATHRGLQGWRAIVADARLHRSPNAGWPEAAMARALNVALSGPRSYDGTVQHFPWVHGFGQKDIGAPQIEAACIALWRTWGAGLAFVVVLAVLGAAL
ncbi:cobalamin biosynthesis protein [Roseovarius gahaiensis]|uniref:Cobalamin biosynthesis protein CobD n=1 Tax=Roseovarius gahaiensis TaxID=2716691 RepID=A0A967BIL8_9RHOB|nr:adenosylcobinamide-phosphate synthase CbiB [Roseovarius gahaiensis]NHQ75462.1 cobalamin biosynthesis protein [Roseovarius gahaiensis]